MRKIVLAATLVFTAHAALADQTVVCQRVEDQQAVYPPGPIAGYVDLAARDRLIANGACHYGTEAASVQIRKAEGAGYQRITGKEFIVDETSLVARHAKVIVTGFYTSRQGTDYLDVAGSWYDPIGITLMIDNASRETKLRFLDCRSQLAWGTFYGCFNMTIVGVAQMCKFADQPDERMACIEVDDSFVGK